MIPLGPGVRALLVPWATMREELKFGWITAALEVCYACGGNHKGDILVCLTQVYEFSNECLRTNPAKVVDVLLPCKNEGCVFAKWLIPLPPDDEAQKQFSKTPIRRDRLKEAWERELQDLKGFEKRLDELITKYLHPVEKET